MLITWCILAPTVFYKARNIVCQNYISLSCGVNVTELQLLLLTAVFTAIKDPVSQYNGTQIHLTASRQPVLYTHSLRTHFVSYKTADYNQINSAVYSLNQHLCFVLKSRQHY